MREIMKAFRIIAVIILVAIGMFILRGGIAILSSLIDLSNIIERIDNPFLRMIVFLFLTEFIGTLIGGIGIGIFCSVYHPERANSLGIIILVLSFIFYFIAILFAGLTINSSILVAQVILFACGVVGLFLGKKMAVRIKGFPGRDKR